MLLDVLLLPATEERLGYEEKVADYNFATDCGGIVV